jgi:hypothetical protein
MEPRGPGKAHVWGKFDSNSMQKWNTYTKADYTTTGGEKDLKLDSKGRITFSLLLKGTYMNYTLVSTGAGRYKIDGDFTGGGTFMGSVVCLK